ncbi:RNA methyltransferase [Candidatus Dependentiae bacterium Noda2021]|nr:RNA methyltransferase [Candidatus Dependentiae bacterium Noda2021]
MKVITSRENPEIKHIIELQSTKGRKEHKQFVAEGTRVCQTLVENGFELDMLYITDDRFDDLKRVIKTPHITLVNEFVMNKISTAHTPSGFLAVFNMPKNQTKALSAGIVLARIADPGNMGTLIRTAAAMGVKTVVCVESTDPWSPKVIQASAGTIANMTVFEMSWQELLKRKNDLPLCGLVLDSAKKPEDTSNKNCLLVIGSEAHGIPTEWIAQCDELITIPMPGNTESLNAGVAGSIALYVLFSNK